MVLSIPPVGQPIAEASSKVIDNMAVERQLRRLAQSAQHVPWLHQEIAQRMSHKLDMILVEPKVCLEWWAFNGGSLNLLTQRYPHATLHLIEPTQALLAKHQSKRSKWQQAWHFKERKNKHLSEKDYTDWTSLQADLVWANMMLHIPMGPIKKLIQNWYQALTMNGFLMFSCLGPDTLKELKDLYEKAGWPPPTQAFTDMHDIGDALVEIGFKDPVMDMEYLTCTWTDPKVLLQDLRALGGNVYPKRYQGLRTPAWLNRLETELAQLRRADGRIALTFEIIYGHAFKSLPTLPPPSETTFSLETMRKLLKHKRVSS